MCYHFVVKRLSYYHIFPGKNDFIWKILLTDLRRQGKGTRVPNATRVADGTRVSVISPWRLVYLFFEMPLTHVDSSR